MSVPSLTGETQPIIRIVEVLPAPFGPRKPNDSPGATSKSIASTAVNVAEPLRQAAGMDERGLGGSQAWAAHGTPSTPSRPVRLTAGYVLRRSENVLLCESTNTGQPGVDRWGPCQSRSRRSLDAALVAELTVVDDRGRPVTYPLIPLYDGERIYMTSSTLFSRKLEHIKANPKVAVSVTDPVASAVGSTGPRSRATPG